MEVGELRLAVSLRGETVRVAFLVSQTNAAGDLARELTHALSARGFHFGGFAEGGTASGHEKADGKMSPPARGTRRRASRRPPGGAHDPPEAPGIQL